MTRALRCGAVWGGRSGTFSGLMISAVFDSVSASVSDVSIVSAAIGAIGSVSVAHASALKID